MPVSAVVVEPSMIKLPRFDHDAVTEATVIARTTTAVGIPADLDFSFVAPPGLEIKLGERVTSVGDIVWPVRVRVSGDAPNDGAVDFRLAYSIAPKGSRPGAATAPIVQLQRARLEVKVEPSRDASPVDDAELSIKTDATAISEGIPLKAYLLIRNKSNHPFMVETLSFDKPKFLTVVATQERAGVGPHDTLRLPLDIEIAKNEKPQIGDWLILASVTLTRGEGEFERRGVAVVEHKVQVGVQGVSDVLKVLDLPSLLLVPGALVLATWSLLFSAVEMTNPKWLEWKNSSFWLVSITVSIFIFGTLSQLTIGPNFLVAFSVRDVALLWLACVGGGAATFALYRVARKSWAKFCAWRAEAKRRAREPLQSDKPIDILIKLERANLPFYLPSHKRTVAGQTQQIFKLGFPAPEGKAWVVPRMMLRQRAQEEPAKSQMQEIVAANNRPADGRAELVAVVKKGLQENWISLDWEAGELSRPEPLLADQISLPGFVMSPINVA